VHQKFESAYGRPAEFTERLPKWCESLLIATANADVLRIRAMRTYLKPLPLPGECEPRVKAVTVVSPEAREVVYLDQSASIELITEALKAWGLRVRAERDAASGRKEPETSNPAEASWQTTRPEGKAPARLDNVLSALWLPIREEEKAGGAEAPAAWSWFSRAA
jgi:hypothetical protein